MLRRAAGAALGFGALALLERLRPLRPRTSPGPERIVKNAALAGTSVLVVGLLELPAFWAASIDYGDSAIFRRRDVYHRIGGFPPWPLFEDCELVRRLERAGRTEHIREVPAMTSGRRYQGRPAGTFVRWVGLQLLFWLGVSPLRLARHYSDAR